MPRRHVLDTITVESRHTRWARCRQCRWQYQRNTSAADTARHARTHVDETGHAVTMHDAVTAILRPVRNR